MTSQLERRARHRETEATGRRRSSFSIAPNGQDEDGQVRPEGEGSTERLAPITYVGSGSLGDFIHQLSVVQEKFIATGRRGRVYLSESGFHFRFGLDRAYADLREIMSGQDYVDSFHVHGGEPVDIDLNKWRWSPLIFMADWRSIFEISFSVPWGSHKWLMMPESEYAGTILIGLSARRQPKVDWEFLKDLPGPAMFVTDSEEELENWRSVTQSDLSAKIFPSLRELYRAIHGCRLFVGNLSSPLAVAMAAHRPSVGLRCHEIDDVHVTGLEKVWPHFRLADREPTREIEALWETERL